MLEVNRAIAQAAEQSHNISKLQAAGLLDTDACAAKLNAINIQLTQLRRERRRLLEHDDIEDTIGRLHQTADAIKAGPEINSLTSSVVYPKRFSKLYQTTSVPVMLKGILMPCIAIQSISFSQRSQSQKAME